MGDLDCWPPLPSSGGAMADLRPVLTAMATPSPDPSAIGAESWRAAEEAARSLLECIQPTVVSEQRRKDVVEYVQMLLKCYLGIDVFPFGSVPLKTYLPDGDIDLTAISFPNREDALANDVRSVLEVEENNREAEFEVKDVQFIHAEVKLIKCIVQNIVVDISFNQIGGLSTLCFLEKVDREIGKDHLLRRSIILIKAWCYYESRILGAHHGLISTYALETLVLHIFHLFHKSLNNPLAVLYRFLNYYSKFDWDNYCISLTGPVSISSLPDVVAEAPENNGADFLFTNEFIKECLELFSFKLRGYENSPRMFAQKHLNIVDPLKHYNNLGRSVSKGNFYRIRSAFAYGARKLGRILILPVDKIADEVRLFFANTWDRHGSGERPDVQGDAPRSMGLRYIELDRFHRTTSPFEPKITSDEMFSSTQVKQHNGPSVEEINKMNVSLLDNENCAGVKYATKSSDQHLDRNSQEKCSKMELCSLTEDSTEDAISNKRLSHDARDLATVRDFHSKTADNASDINSVSNAVKQLSPFNTPGGADADANCEIESTSKAFFSRENTSCATSGSISESSVANLTSSDLEYSNSSVSLTGENGFNRSPRLISLSDLSGNENLHFLNFQCALRSQLINPFFVATQQMSPHYRSKQSWNSLSQQNMFTPIGINRLVPGSPFSPGSYLVSPPAISGAYASKDTPRTRGTGTFFPNTNSRSYRERQLPVKGKNQVYNKSPRSYFSGREEVPKDRKMSEGGKPDPVLNPYAPVFNGVTCRKPAHLDILQSSQAGSSWVSDGNDFDSEEIKLQCGTLGSTLEAPLSEQANKLETGNSLNQISEPVIPVSTAQKQPMNSKFESLIEPYQLKDDGDFPPLAS